MAKRARERAREERKHAKKERRLAAAGEPAASGAPDEAALMEEFRVMSERHASGQVSDEALHQERHRIFVELGIETEDDD